jgi:hypothetical protein
MARQGKYKSHRLYMVGGKTYKQYKNDWTESAKRLITKYGVGVDINDRPLKINTG